LGLEVHYRRPIYINDTVTLHLEVKEKKPPQRGERGLVIFNTMLINQSNRVTADGIWTLMMKTRAAMAAASTTATPIRKVT
jgi:acyl dehydratase